MQKDALISTAKTFCDAHRGLTRFLQAVLWNGVMVLEGYNLVQRRAYLQRFHILAQCIAPASYNVCFNRLLSCV